MDQTLAAILSKLFETTATLSAANARIAELEAELVAAKATPPEAPKGV